MIEIKQEEMQSLKVRDIPEGEWFVPAEDSRPFHMLFRMMGEEMGIHVFRDGLYAYGQYSLGMLGKFLDLYGYQFKLVDVVINLAVTERR